MGPSSPLRILSTSLRYSEEFAKLLALWNHGVCWRGILVKLAKRVWNARERPVCADRIERSAERVEAVPDGIILDDF